jgi:hypothetical protein
MTRPAPPIDPRGRPELMADTERLARLLSAWRPPAEGTDLGRALIAVFAGMAEEVVHRLNAVPDRDFLAFLELLGAEPLPARAATAPLTFALASGRTAVALVPVGTPAAAPRPGGDPARFFTERDLVVSPAGLAAAVVLEPAADRWADVTAAANGAPGPSWAAFAGDSLIEHALYVAADEFATLPRPRSLGVAVRLPDSDARDAFAALPLQWSRWDGSQWEALAATLSTPRAAVLSVDLGDVAVPEPRTVGGRPGRWLRARLTRAIDTVPRLAQAPVAGVDVTAVVAESADAVPDAGLVGTLPVDLSGDVFPFGEQPRFTDSFSLASPVFGRPEAQATVRVAISDGLTTPPVPSSDLILVWEVGGADGWVEVGRSGPGAPPSTAPFADTTAAFTTDGEVRFTVPSTGGPVVLAGISGWWLRARIAAGNYGTAATFRPSPDPARGPVLVPATLAPPALSSVLVRWRFRGQEAASTVLTVNGDDVADHTAPTGSFLPFTPTVEDRPALHLGFDRPFPNRPVLLYLLVDPSPPDSAALGTSPLLWEYAGPSGWVDLRPVDETRGLTRSAPVTFIGPPDLAPTSRLGRSLCWLRVRPGEPGAAGSLRLRRILTNTVPATAAVTAPPEVLGTSDGSAGQAFRTARGPVLDGERVEVLAGSDWRAWARTPNFAGSGAVDRHYVLDRDLGEIRFGNGRRGAIPPAGAAIRCTYASGGGSADNRPAEAVTQLEVALAGVDRVTNHEPAAGGADAEPVDRVRVRGPLGLRHGGRAVAAEDYADLAAAASPDVARALAVPVAVNPLDVPWIDPVPVDPDLDGSPLDGSVLCSAPAAAVPAHSPPTAGRVTVAVVPESGDARPVPSRQLLEEVAGELRTRCPSVVADAGLTVVGPVWLEVTVRVTVAVADPQGAQTLPAAVTAALDRFLHPLHGGPDGGGWAFGRAPHPSDLLALLTALPGTDHVVRLDVAEDPDRGGLSPEDLARALVWPGSHEVTVVPAGGTT